MKNLFRLGILGALVFRVTALAGQQTAPAPVEPGSIQGVVTRQGTNEPLSSAQVVLQGGASDPQAMQVLLNTAASQGIVVSPAPGATAAETIQALSSAAIARGFALTTANLQSQLASLSGKAPPMTTTDRDGRFTFKDIAPGSYTVRAQKDGYFGKPEGGLSQPSAAIDVRVAAKETKEANITMVPGAIVGGRIFDAMGQLMSNANVQAYTVAYAFGQAVLAPLVSKVTDDRGEYRLFWVPPGDYYIAVTPRQAAPTPGVPAAASSLRTYYPGVSTVAEARVISIRGGEDMGGMDIGIRNTPTFRVSGQVNSTVPPPPLQLGAPGVNAAVLMLANRDGNTPDDAGARQVGVVPLLPTSGQFEIANIPPGSYELFARVSDPAAQVAGGLPVAWGRARLDIRDTDIAGVGIVVNPSVEVKGTAAVNGGGKMPSAARIQLLPDGGALKIPAYQAIFARSAPVTPEGTFAVPAVPEGRYRVNAVAGLTPDLYLADVRQNAMSVFDSGFEVGARSPGPIEVIVGSGAGTVNGIVQDGPTKVVPGATVVLVPEASRRENRALYFAAVSDASGRFVIRGVPPGDYKAFAWESIPSFAYQNSGFISRHEEKGRIVHLGQSGTVTLELAIIPAIEKK